MQTGAARGAGTCNVTANFETNNNDFVTVQIRVEVQETNTDSFMFAPQIHRRTGEMANNIGRWRYVDGKVLPNDDNDNK